MIREKGKLYRQKNKEKIKEEQEKYRRENKEKIKQQNKSYYKKKKINIDVFHFRKILKEIILGEK